MAQILPYDVTTATGEKIAFEFPLHAETQSAMRVQQLLDAVLGTLDRELHNHASEGEAVHELTVQDQPLNIAMESLLWQENLKTAPVLLGTQVGFDTNRHAEGSAT